MAEDEDISQKTEEPTPRRLEEAYKEGKVVVSKEVSNFLMILSLSIMLVWVYPYLAKFSFSTLRYYITSPIAQMTEQRPMLIIELTHRIIFDFLSIISIPLVIAVVTAIAGHLLQHRFIFSTDLLKFDISRISPIKGFARIFSMRSVVELLKGLVKIIIISIAVYFAISPEFKILNIIHSMSIAGFLGVCVKFMIKVMTAACVVMGVVAVLDYLYQRYEFMKSMRMTKQEVKEEYRQTEGSPEVKAKQKSLRLQAAKKRMMAAVPTADVVITNPTHFAVALKYTHEEMPAPKVIAKGADNIALKIKEIAINNMIPVVENPVLARALFNSVEIDEFIPFDHYKDVAEVISYVMRLRGKKLGSKPKKS